MYFVPSFRISFPRCLPLLIGVLSLPHLKKLTSERATRNKILILFRLFCHESTKKKCGPLLSEGDRHEMTHHFPLYTES